MTPQATATDTHDAMMPPPKLYRIGELMRFTGLTRQTLHYYTVVGLISEMERTDGGQRLYGEETFRRIARVKELQKSGRTLRQIRDILGEEFGGEAC